MCPLETFVIEVELRYTDTKNATARLHGNISQAVHVVRYGNQHTGRLADSLVNFGGWCYKSPPYGLVPSHLNPTDTVMF